jgi:hypothetical protein
MVVLDAILVAHHLPVHLVHEFIDCSVQIGMGAFGEQVGPFDVDIAFGALALFLFLLLFNGEQDLDIDHLVEMPGDPIQLGGDITAQGGG